MRNVLSAFVIVLAAAVPALAQSTPSAGTPAPAAPQATAPPAPQRGTTPTPSPTAKRVDAGVDPIDANIKLTLTITDKGGAVPLTKTMSLTVANQGSGRVRSTGSMKVPTQTFSPIAAGGAATTTTSYTYATISTSVDAEAQVRKSGLIHANLTIYYTPGAVASPEVGDRPNDINESISVFLRDGVPTIVTQAADPTNSSRTVTVEVTASIIK